MSMGIKQVNQISQINQANRAKQAQANQANQGSKSFQDLLADSVRQAKPASKPATAAANLADLPIRQYAITKPGLTVSKHARLRAEQRNIDIDEALEKIGGAVTKAAGKNLKNVLVLSNDAAFIVSVASNVVVTAMSGDDMRDSVITNIDGTVIV